MLNIRRLSWNHKVFSNQNENLFFNAFISLLESGNLFLMFSIFDVLLFKEMPISVTGVSLRRCILNENGVHVHASQTEKNTQLQ